MAISNFTAKSLNVVFHALVSATYVFVIRHDATLFSNDEHNKLGFPFDISYGGRLKFLTYINMNLQALYFALYAIVIVTNSKKLNNLANFLYTRIIFPFGMQVCIVFWALYFIDRNLIYPVKLDRVFTWQQNHVMHTLPAVSLLVHNFLEEHRYPSFYKGVSVTIICCLSYLGWLFYIAHDSGKWVYTVFTTLNSPLYRGAFCALNVTFAALLYKVGDAINSIIYARKPNTTGTKKAKKVK